MKLELTTQMGKMRPGETLIPRSKEQGEMLINEGFAKEVPEDVETEKVLVLRNPEPGTYTTEWVDKDSKAAAIEANKESGTTETVTLKATELIEKINAATTAEEVNQLVPETETRKTVTDAASKKLEELKG